jgi:vacuolar-type H+-ATPase subunit I/STV1
MNDLDEYVDGFNSSLQTELGDILTALQLHDSITGQNHSDIITMLDDLLSGSIGTEGIADLKTMLTNLAQNLSSTNQSIASDISSVVGDIDEFERITSQKLNEINQTLAELIKLDSILTELAQLDSALQDAEENLEEEINEIPTEKAEEDESIGFIEILLMIAIVLLLVNLIVGLMGMKRKREEPPDQIPMQLGAPQQPQPYQQPPQMETPPDTTTNEEMIPENKEQEFPPPQTTE